MKKMMFWIGLILVVIAAVLLIGNFMGDSTFPPILGLLGVILIGASGYKPMKKKKK